MAILPLPFDIPDLYGLALLFLLLIVGIVIIILIAKVLLFILPAGIIGARRVVLDRKLVLGRCGFSGGSIYLFAEKMTKTAINTRKNAAVGGAFRVLPSSQLDIAIFEF